MKTYEVKIEADGDDLVMVFPPEAMLALGLKIGDEVAWSIEGNTAILRKVGAVDTAAEGIHEQSARKS